MDQKALAPALLIAMPQLADPNFHRAVVLLIEHDENGTFGLVLNRPTDVLAYDLCQAMDIHWKGSTDAMANWGGPVQPNTGWMIFDEEGRHAVDEEKNFMGDLYFSGSVDTLREISLRPPNQVRLYLGYAGWGPGQLEAELAQGAWILAPIQTEVIFEVPMDEIWLHVLQSLGIDPTTLISTPGVH